MPITIKEITVLETYSVRHPVLRVGRPIEDCAMQGDDLETTFHLAAVEDDRIIGVATFLVASDEAVKEITGKDLNLSQLRGMAVLPASQGKGIGNSLLKEGIKQLKTKNIDVLWFNARIKAVPFYEGLGFEILGSAFEVEQIGTHYKMYRRL